MLGFLAVPVNLGCVLYLTGPGDPTWVKPAAFVFASAYGVSGILNVLLDFTFFSVRRSVPRFVLVLRAHAWLLVAGVLTIMLEVSIMMDRWAADMEPLAWLACGLTYVIGMKTRDYDRFVRLSRPWCS